MKIKKYILFAFLLIIFFVFLFIFKELRNDINVTGHDTLISSAHHNISIYLYKYYKANGKYPATLSEPLNIHIAKTALHSLGVANQKEFLKKIINYKNTDNSYELSIKFPHDSALKIEKEFGEYGQAIACAYYKNGKLYDKYIASDVNSHIKAKYSEEAIISWTINDSDANKPR